MTEPQKPQPQQDPAAKPLFTNEAFPQPVDPYATAPAQTSQGLYAEQIAQYEQEQAQQQAPRVPQPAPQPVAQQTWQQPQQQQAWQQPQQPPMGGYVAQPMPYQTGAYAMSSTDRTLRLIAFIFTMISTVTMGFLIVPLIWMIPMAVHTWGIYKGMKANTVGFAVCSLIFVSLVSGILLLVSKHDR